MMNDVFFTVLSDFIFASKEFKMKKFKWLLIGCMFISSNGFGQGYFESLSGEADYLYFGIGFQSTPIRSAYVQSGVKQNDVASGMFGSFAWEQYGENHSGWMKLDASLLFDAVLSSVSNYRGPKLKNYEKGIPPSVYEGFLINNKFLHGQAAWTFGESSIGPLVSFGWEGVGLVEQFGKKGGSIQDAIGEENPGLISMGTGLNWLQPFSVLPEHSRLTIAYDWFLNRKNENKFWYGGSSRGRVSVDLSMMVARRLNISVGFAYFNFKNAYKITAGTVDFPEEQFIDSKMTTIKFGVAYNFIAK